MYRALLAIIAFLVLTAPVEGQPAAPGNLAINSVNQFGLMWDYSEVVTSFIIQVAPAGQTSPLTTLLIVPGSAMLDGKVATLNVPIPPAGVWDLTVVATSSSGTSPPSNTVRLTVSATATPDVPCTYIPAGFTVMETRPVGYLLIGRIVYVNADANSKTLAATRVEQLRSWGWIGSPWPEIDPVDGKSVLRIRFWCRRVPNLQ